MKVINPRAALGQAVDVEELHRQVAQLTDENRELRDENRELRRQLQSEQLSTDWWWHEARQARRQAQRESSSWKTARLTSPLTTLQQWGRGMTTEGYAYHHWETSCPCCKRPLDITIFRDDRAPAAHAAAGSRLRCFEATPREKGVPVYEALRSYKRLGFIQPDEIVTALAPVEDVGGYPMLPIEWLVDGVSGTGAVDVRFFELLPEPTQATAATWAPSEEGEVAADAESPPRYAYCAAIWGANGGYALGAASLGARLRELTQSEPPAPPPGGALAPQLDRVLLHTDDVPPNFLEVLGEVWTLRQVDYIDGVEELYNMRGTAFDGVFTKLAAWGLTEYEKVLLLDIDLVILKAPHALFDLEAPAAFVRGNGQLSHGEAVGGRRFFAGEANCEYAWGQGGGINAGVILLSPDEETLDRMLREVKSVEHPEHVHGNGPEQDYLTRYFASAPWHHMDVRWNYQVHHLPYALEQVVAWREFQLQREGRQEDAEWLAPRMKMNPDDICIVHFSGDVKPWHLLLDAVQDDDQRRAVEHAPSSWRWKCVHEFGEHLLERCCASYGIWFARDASPDAFDFYGCALTDDGRIEIRHPRPSVAAQDSSVTPRSEDITQMVDDLVAKARSVTTMAVEAWLGSSERFLEGAPEAIEIFGSPTVPLPDNFIPGTEVFASWPAHVTYPSWYAAQVVSVHSDGRYVVRFKSAGSWGDTERGVPHERLQSREVAAAAEEEPANEKDSSPTCAADGGDGRCLLVAGHAGA